VIRVVVTSKRRQGKEHPGDFTGSLDWRQPRTQWIMRATRMSASRILRTARPLVALVRVIIFQSATGVADALVAAVSAAACTACFFHVKANSFHWLFGKVETLTVVDT